MIPVTLKDKSVWTQRFEEWLCRHKVRMPAFVTACVLWKQRGK